MKTFTIWKLAAVAVLFVFLQQACAPKKVALQPAAEVVQEKPEPAPVVEEKPAPAPAPEPAPVEAPNFNFRNIQFEYDSHVLKTESYAVLDQISREMDKDPDAKFYVNGHASIEGTAEYNMSLSVDRANAVKLYLVNSGISGNNLITEGFGATQPVASNNTEAGRTLNRRVEIKLVNGSGQ